jgi:hypothetical protein
MESLDLPALGNRRLWVSIFMLAGLLSRGKILGCKENMDCTNVSVLAQTAH